MAARSLSLLESEESLDALLDTADLVAPEQEQEFLEDLAAQLQASAAKRDRFAGRMAMLERREEYCAAEVKRLKELKAWNEAERLRMERYVTYVIQRLGKDANGRWRKLEGNTSVLGLAACPPSIQVLSEHLVPIEYKSATVTMPAALWHDILRVLDDQFAEQVIRETSGSLQLSIDKRALRSALEAKVPGLEDAAMIVTDKTSVRRK